MSNSLIPNFTQIPNIFIDYWQRKLKPTSFSVLVTLCRKIYGWHKTSDSISINQMMECTGLTKNTIKTAIDELLEYGLIQKIQTKGEHGWKPNEFKLNVLIPEDTMYSKSENREPPRGNVPHENRGGGSKFDPGGRSNFDPGVGQILTLQKKDHTKEKKKERKTSPQARRLASLFFKKIIEGQPKTKEPNLQKWAEDIDDLMTETTSRKIPYTADEIERVILWSQENEFWSTNIRCVKGLKKHIDRLILIINVEAMDKKNIEKKEKQIETDTFQMNKSFATEWMEENINIFTENIYAHWYENHPIGKVAIELTNKRDRNARGETRYEILSFSDNEPQKFKNTLENFISNV